MSFNLMILAADPKSAAELNMPELNVSFMTLNILISLRDSVVAILLSQITTLMTSQQ